MFLVQRFIIWHEKLFFKYIIKIEDNPTFFSISEASLDSPTSAGPSHKRIKRAKLNRSLEWPQESISEEPINMIKGSFTNNHHDHSYERTAVSFFNFHSISFFNFYSFQANCKIC